MLATLGPVVRLESGTLSRKPAVKVGIKRPFRMRPTVPVL